MWPYNSNKKINKFNLTLQLQIKIIINTLTNFKKCGLTKC